MRIAVVGGGISGLTVAYRLHEQHQVTLFEAADYLGGHTNTVDVDHDGDRFAVDTGFIVFNDRNYPQFTALLDELKIASRPTAMSFSVRADAADLEYEGSSLSGLFAQRRNLVRPAFYRLLRDILRFNRIGSAGDARESARATVGEFLAAHRFSQEFVDYYLLPMGSAIWSCPLGTFANFPIEFILEFFRHHGLLDLTNRPQWRVVERGSRNYVAALTRNFRDTTRLRTPITAIRRTADGVEIVPRGGEAELFDHVVLACHADQALRMLSDPTPAETDVLSAFPYERNTAVLHTDVKLLPKRRRAWAAWNYLLLDSPSNSPTPQRATVTYCMNILQHLESRHTYCVSLNVDERIDPSKVLGRFTYEHPIFTTSRAAAQARHGEISGVERTSYCGAYWGNGFHEDGVASAMRVVESLRAAKIQPRVSAHTI
jgi:predicted NAD/FAD-binding protein